MNPEPAPKKKRGRPRVWRDDKERMRAYRERKRQGMVQPATPTPEVVGVRLDSGTR